MTYDHLIALVTSIAACLSALATFLTVRQVKMQREASYRPELMFSRTRFDAVSEGGSLPERWVRPKSEPQPKYPPRDLTIPLHNIGLGAAKEVVIEWSFPVEHAIEKINRAAQQTLTPIYFSTDGEEVTIKSETFGNGTSMWINQRKGRVDFVLPTSVNGDSARVPLPQTYILLASATLFFHAKSDDPSFEVPALLAHLSYLDIGDQSHTASFKFELRVISLAGDGHSFKAFIDCVKS
jgi:hypothetical protein